MRSNIKELLFIKLPLYLSLSFGKQILTKQNIAFTKNCQDFLASQVPVLKRSKATNSSTSNHPFFSCNEKRVFGNLDPVYIEYILSSSLFPSGKVPVRMCWQVLKVWINYQIQGFSLQLKNGWLEVLELVALFLFKTGTCDAKNSWEFFVDAIFCFVKICFQKRGTNTT